jgi:hypothetical protein
MPSIALPAGGILFPALTVAMSSQVTEFQEEQSGLPPYVVLDRRTRPRRDIQLVHVFLPVAVYCQVTPPATNATTALIALFMLDGSRTFWTQSLVLNLLQDGATGESAANTNVVDDFVNPIDLALTDEPVMYGRVSFDQPTVSSRLYIGAAIPNPIGGGGGWQQAPGAFDYQITD